MEIRFSDDFLKALEFSRDEAVRTGWHNICPDHIMLGILRLGSADAVLEAAGVSPAAFKSAIDDAVFVPEAVAWEERDSVHLCESARGFLEHACLEARRCGSDLVEPFHFILAVSRINGPFSHDYLDNCGVSLRALVEASGREWSSYGLGNAASSSPASPAPEPPAPDPVLMALAIEKRLREGYSTGDVPVS